MFSDEEKAGRVVAATWETVLIRIGIPYEVRAGSGVLEAECPFCRHPSKKMNLWEKSGRFSCHNCGVEGDKVDLIHQIYPSRKLTNIFSEFGTEERRRRYPVAGHPELVSLN